MMKRAPASSFAMQLVVLRHLLRLGELEGRDAGADEEVAGRRGRPLAGVDVDQPLVHVLQQLDQGDGVEVEGGFGEAPVAFFRVVAGEGEDVAQAHALQGVAAGDGAVAGEVLAGEVDDAVEAGALDLLRQLIGHDGSGRRPGCR